MRTLSLTLVLALVVPACNKEPEKKADDKKEEKKDDKVDKKDDKADDKKADKPDDKADKKDDKADKKDDKADKKDDKKEACKLPGQWTGKTPPGPTPMNDQQIDITFDADGTSTWVSKVATQKGKWTLDDKGAFTIANTGEVKGPFQCKAGEVGKYKATWDGCDAIKFELDADACKGRAGALGGNKMSRKKP